jgi:hypothetical protein
MMSLSLWTLLYPRGILIDTTDSILIYNMKKILIFGLIYIIFVGGVLITAPRVSRYLQQRENKKPIGLTHKNNLVQARETTSHLKQSEADSKHLALEIVKHHKVSWQGEYITLENAFKRTATIMYKGNAYFAEQGVRMDYRILGWNTARVSDDKYNVTYRTIGTTYDAYGYGQNLVKDSKHVFRVNIKTKKVAPISNDAIEFVRYMRDG